MARCVTFQRGWSVVILEDLEHARLLGQFCAHNLITYNHLLAVTIIHSAAVTLNHDNSLDFCSNKSACYSTLY